MSFLLVRKQQSRTKGPPGGPLFQPPAAWNKPAEKDPLAPYTHIHGLAYTLIYISAKVISLLHVSVVSPERYPNQESAQGEALKPKRCKPTPKP